jgi:hypothetical protein
MMMPLRRDGGPRLLLVLKPELIVIKHRIGRVSADVLSTTDKWRSPSAVCGIARGGSAAVGQELMQIERRRVVGGGY